jgi:ectoine hydroxylase-related dioxygenase (phytanoyl-CoA dioxygenase family)
MTTRESFERDGFVVIPNFFDPAFGDSVLHAVARYIEAVVPALPAGRVYHESNSAAIKSMSAMDREDEFFAALKRHPRLLALAAELLGSTAIVVENMQFFGKAAGEGSAAPWHQDNGFQNYTPPEACMFWLALDDVTEDNGCVCFARGSHAMGLQPHRPSGILGFSMGAGAPPLDRFPEVKAIMPKGGLSVHHCNTFHRSGPNRSASPRRAIAINFRTEAAVADLEARARIKQEAARLLEREFRP